MDLIMNWRGMVEWFIPVQHEGVVTLTPMLYLIDTAGHRAMGLTGLDLQTRTKAQVIPGGWPEIFRLTVYF